MRAGRAAPRGVEYCTADRECARPHHARATRHQRHGDGDDHVLHAGAEDRDHGQRHDDQREGHQHVHHALQDEVDQAAEIGAADAQHEAGETADESRDETNDQRGARAVDDARQQVAAELSVPSQCAALGGSVRATGNRWASTQGAIHYRQGGDRGDDDDQAEVPSAAAAKVSAASSRGSEIMGQDCHREIPFTEPIRGRFHA